MLEAREIKQRILREILSLLPNLIVGKIEVNKRFSGKIFDLAFRIKTQNRRKRFLVCEIKQFLQPRMAREASARFKEKITNLDRVYPVLITTFLGERTREIFKKEGIGYLDLAGNCFLKFNNIYIEKIVNKNPFVEEKRPKTVFKPISSRILRTLLEEPKRSWRILGLSKVAKVSLGQTSSVCRWLIDEEYLKRDKDGFYSLTEPGKLLDEWQQNYTYRQNEMLAYYSFEQNLTKLIKRVKQIAKNKDLNYGLTLLCGASLVAPFIRGVSTLQMYISDTEDIPKWVQLLDLRPVETGSNISICIPYDEGVFYKTQKVDGIKIVGNIQLYLDLYNYPTRGREQAEFLRREKIKF